MVTERVINKIKKVLVLSNSPYPEEAKTAMLKAQELMLQHGLSMADVQFETKEDKEVVDQSVYEVNRITWWKQSLSLIIGDNFRCYPYIKRYSNVTKVQFVGLQEDVELAKEVYLYAISVIEYLSVQYIKVHKEEIKINSRRVKNQYILGFLDGLVDRFKKQVESNESFSLILVKDSLVEETYNKINLRKSKKSHITIEDNDHARITGYYDGNNFDANRKMIQNV
ncbi:hypothetical protein Dtox_2450 [Desulfofarcimen acetoxidans DSM 771]|uniref:Uncharacterized protein n=1 Tax=Desulfofarcimen acetoxidans (strain ATCC 49208 / DSM 771 / KCTC 5769 / VKM B-1644 / 5575) TaxID=485916 RepID=C8W0K4_DESAS|nr:DUF2786 domain-containing protein [Desulfofarcimen acetoxidans]ACV63259.1 hypothetical protein Dtox_2450 [Desulfofarcimen acetoxidans DSM 771]